jgi:hypothetical protein
MAANRRLLFGEDRVEDAPVDEVQSHAPARPRMSDDGVIHQPSIRPCVIGAETGRSRSPEDGPIGLDE